MHVVDAVKNYVVALAEATRNHPEIRLGASPRASLHLLRTAKAAAAMAGRDYVLPDDVQQLAVPVLAHRLIPAADGHGGRPGAGGPDWPRSWPRCRSRPPARAA